jgi:hypothetical protein
MKRDIPVLQGGFSDHKKQILPYLCGDGVMTCGKYFTVTRLNPAILQAMQGNK